MIAKLTPELLRSLPLPAHDGEVDKDDRGRLLIVGGSAEVPGAVRLAGEAGLRAGAGKLQIATVASVVPAMAVAVPEARVVALAEVDGDIAEAAAPRLAELVGHVAAAVVGPGMTEAAAVTRAALGAAGEAKLVLDAAAIAAIAGEEAACRRCDGRLVLTPHAGEMCRLMGCDEDRVADDPDGLALRAARRFGAVVALKGGRTRIASPDGRLWLFEGGCVGLATSGSGDVLAGVIGGLLARGADPVTATLWGVTLHAAAGNRLSARHGHLGFLARELPAEIPALLGDICS